MYSRMKMMDAEAGISKDVLIAWKKGNVRAFEMIVKNNMRMAYSIALGLVGNPDDAKDLSQEAFIAAHHARKSFDVKKPFFPWFYRILKNRCINFILGKRRRREISLDVLVEREDHGAAPDRLVMKQENREALWRALQSLSPEHREIITLREFHDMPYREIAAVLSISEGTVMSRLYYARRALLKALRRDGAVHGLEGDE